MILTLVEKNLDGSAVEVSLEALTFARNLSATGGGVPVDAVVVGEVGDDLRKDLAAYGVRNVHRGRRRRGVAAYSGAGWASAILAASAPRPGSVVVLAAGTDRGNELMAHVAARAGVAMAANVLSFQGLSPFTVTRQVVGGAALEEMVLDQRPAVFTVAGHAVEAGAGRVARVRPTSSSHTPEIDAVDLVARVVSTEQVEADQSGGLKSAKVVVGAGRGAGGADGFDDRRGADHAARRLARRLPRGDRPPAGGRTTSRSARPARRISPDLYIPCGISGAIQHWAGCASAKNILAINTDAEAPMVTRATYAVIGDMHEVLPAINEEIKRRRGVATYACPGRAGHARTQVAAAGVSSGADAARGVQRGQRRRTSRTRTPTPERRGSTGPTADPGARPRARDGPDRAAQPARSPTRTS